MKERTSQYFVIFVAISLIIGAFSNDVVENEALVLSITVAALAFTLLDFFKILNLHGIIKYILLFIAVFSITVLPYLEGIHKLISGQADRITIIGLALVILIIGLKQFKDEKNDILQIKAYLEETELVIKSHKEIINEQNDIIEKLNARIQSQKQD